MGLGLLDNQSKPIDHRYLGMAYAVTLPPPLVCYRLGNAATSAASSTWPKCANREATTVTCRVQAESRVDPMLGIASLSSKRNVVVVVVVRKQEPWVINPMVVLKTIGTGGRDL
jgi:hypothetical protein